MSEAADNPASSMPLQITLVATNAAGACRKQVHETLDVMRDKNALAIIDRALWKLKRQVDPNDNVKLFVENSKATPEAVLQRCRARAGDETCTLELVFAIAPVKVHIGRIGSFRCFFVQSVLLSSLDDCAAQLLENAQKHLGASLTVNKQRLSPDQLAQAVRRYYKQGDNVTVRFNVPVVHHPNLLALLRNSWIN
jgi:hypothetical protein